MLTGSEEVRALQRAAANARDAEKINRFADELDGLMTVVRRQALVDSRFPTVVCAPVFTRGHGLETEVSVRPEEGLKHPGWIGCDGLVSTPRAGLPTTSVAALSANSVVSDGQNPWQNSSS
jgi:mRNA-degrading endonuclease toxin of MazEF toxin-antitoxin module